MRGYATPKGIVRHARLYEYLWNETENITPILKWQPVLRFFSTWKSSRWRLVKLKVR